MNCRRAKQNIALFAGNDLDRISARELRRHLKDCPACVDHWRKMKASVAALQTPCWNSRPIGDSVWPGLAVRLAEQRETRPAERFNGWAPALAVVAACVLMLFFSQSSSPTAGTDAARMTPASVLSPGFTAESDWPDARSRHAPSADDIEQDNNDFLRMLDDVNRHRKLGGPFTRSRATPVADRP